MKVILFLVQMMEKSFFEISKHLKEIKKFPWKKEQLDP